MKRFRFLALLSAAALALSACGSDASDGASPARSDSSAKVTIGLTYVPDVQFAPFYVAKNKGYFEQEGLNVTIRHHGPQESLMGALQAGDEDVVVAGADEMLQARSNGVAVYSWGTLYQKYPVKVLVRKDSTINSAADLRGKKVGLPGQYGENYYALLAMLKENNLTQKNVDIQYIGYTQAAALSSGQVDAVIGYTNSDAVAIENQGVDVRAIEAVDGGLPLIGVSCGSLDSFRSEGNVKEKKMKTALNKAVEFMRSNPEETLDITGEYVATFKDPQVRATAAKVLASTMELFGSGDVLTQDSVMWQKMSEFMESADLLDKPVDASQAFITVE